MTHSNKAKPDKARYNGWIDSTIYEKFKELAEKDGRKYCNMINKLITDYCNSEG